MKGTCGVMFNNNASVTDTNGCFLPHGHDGEHEFKCTSGRTFLWHTDMECDCDDCASEDANDWCSIYHEKKMEKSMRQKRIMLPVADPGVTPLSPCISAQCALKKE